MGVPTITGLPPNPDFGELVTKVNTLVNELRNLLLTLDSNNALEFGGWQVELNKFISIDRDVGMSTEDTGADDVRFFAGPNGAAWFYYVTKSGKLYATDAFITGVITGSVIIGSEIKTSETAYPRIELSSLGTFFKALGSIDKSIEISVSTEGTPGQFFKDLTGTGLIDFLNGVFSLMSTANMLISATNVSAVGTWAFNNTINGSITGHAASADYADHAGTASAADELSPSGEIAWGQVLKNGSNVADLEVRNLSSLTQTSSFRTVTDSDKLVWNAKSDLKKVDGSGVTGSESTFSGFYYASLTITYSGFTNAPKIIVNKQNLGSWVSAIGPVTTTSATIYITSTQTGFVSGIALDWSAIGT